MQADEDIGKVAQITPHVVSRALELFMIRLISASADQVRTPSASARINTPGVSGGGGGGGGGGKLQKKILSQHLKKAITGNETFDFLTELALKVPDAPAKTAAKKEESDSEENVKKPKRKAASRKRKDPGDDA